MSACIVLYRIADKSEFTTKKTFVTDYKDIGVDPFWTDFYYDSNWNTTFSTLNIYGGKKSTRVGRDRKMFKKLSNTRPTELGYVIVAKEVDNICGWFFKRKLFRVKDSIYWAYTKEEAQRLVKNLVDFEKLARYYNILDSTDTEAIEEYNHTIETINKMVDMTGNGYILEIAW